MNAICDGCECAKYDHDLSVYRGGPASKISESQLGGCHRMGFIFFTWLYCVYTIYIHTYTRWRSCWQNPINGR